MDVAVENIGILKKRLLVTVPASEIDSVFTKKYKTLKSKANIKGFRPGKIPVNLLRKRFGHQIAEEVREKIVEQNHEKAVGKSGCKPVTRLVADHKDLPTEGSNFAFTLEFSVFPEFEFLPPETLKLEKQTPSFDEKYRDYLIEMEIDYLHNFVEKNDQAAYGEIVYINQKGLIDNEERSIFSRKEARVKITDQEGLFPEMIEALQNMKTGDKKIIEVHVPDEPQFQENERGKIAQVHLEVTKVEMRDDVPHDKDFFAKLGADIKSEQDLLEYVNKALLAESEKKIEGEYQKQLTEQFHSLLSFDVPEAILDENMQASRERFEKEAEKKKAEEIQAFDAEAVKKEIIASLRLEFYLQKHIEEHKIKAETEELSLEIGEKCRMYGIEDPNKFIKTDFGRRMLDMTAKQITENKAFNDIARRILQS